jgi:hypothetical protein
MDNATQDASFVMERNGRIEEMDRSFDVAYWQRFGPNAIFAAAWEMVVEAHRLKGASESELELQRTVETVKRLRR